MASRFIGGQRTSDLHAWRWSDIDLEHWQSCIVRRPKTERGDDGELTQSTLRVTHKINEDERVALQRWWEHEKQPQPRRDAAGRLVHDPYVFPTRIGPRAGEQKQGTGYARSLRIAMTRALGLEESRQVIKQRRRKYKDGSIRVMTYESTVWEKVREPKGREVTLLQGDDQYRPLNMHTMRRAYASGLALAGWSRAQMKNAGGWRTDAMPARYDLSAQQTVVDANGTTPRLRLVPPPEDHQPPPKTSTQISTTVPNGAGLGENGAHDYDLRAITMT